MSSDSDGYNETSTSSRLSVPRSYSSTQRKNHPTASKVEHLTSSLEDTNRKVNSAGELLLKYREVNERQSSTISRLRDNLSKSTDHLRQERLRKESSQSESRTLHASDLESAGDRIGRREYRPTSPLRDYRVISGSISRSSRPTGTVRFDEKVDEIHDLHQAVRDLSSDQIRLGQDLDNEIKARNKQDVENRRTAQDMSGSLRQSHRPAPEENSSSRVEKRLREIQDELRQQRLEQEAKDRKVRGVNKEYERRQRSKDDMERDRSSLFSEMKSIVSSQRRDEEKVLRDRLLQAEAEKQKMVHQLEATRRQLERSEGNKEALEQKMDSIQNQFARSQDHQKGLQEKLSQFQNVFEEEGIPLSSQQRREQRLRAPLSRTLTYAQQQQDRDREKLEREIESLREKLTDATSVRDRENMREELQRSERQRDQLSQHLESLNKELDDKDKHQSKLVQQLQSVSENMAESERQRILALSQLDDLQKKLRESSRRGELTEQTAADHGKLLEDSERKRAELKSKAQDAIRQWKVKCKRAEKELEGVRQSSSQSSDRFENLLRENENLKSQTSNMAHKMENLQREMQDILEKRAMQDEQLSRKDIELNQLKSTKMELEQELRESRKLMDKADGELQNHHARFATLSEEKLRKEEEVFVLSSQHQKLLKENQNLQEDLNKAIIRHSERSTRSTEEASKRKDLEQRLQRLEAELDHAKEENVAIFKELKEEREAQEMLMQNWQIELKNCKEKAERDIHDLMRKLKRERAEFAAEIQTLKIDIAEEKATSKSLRKQLDRSKHDNERLRADLSQADAETTKLRRNYDRMKSGFEEQLQLTEVGDNRASVLQKQLESLEHITERQIADYEACLQTVAKEIDVTFDLVSGENSEGTLIWNKSPTPKKDLEGHPERWMSDLQNQLKWLREEMRHLLSKKRKLKDDLNRSRNEVEDFARSYEFEKVRCEDEKERAEEIYHKLASSNKDLEIQNLEKSGEVSSLVTQVNRLETHIESNAKVLEQTLSVLPDPEPLILNKLNENQGRIQDFQKERDRINERYLKYQNTLTLLQKQLADVKHPAKS